MNSLKDRNIFSQTNQIRRLNKLFFFLILFLLTSFVVSIVSAKTNNIYFTNIWYKKVPNFTHLTIKANGIITNYEVNYLEEPDRIVIDIKNAFYDIKELSKNILFLNMGSVKQVRCGQFESEPVPITRFVVDLFQKANYEVKLSEDKRLLHIDVYDYEEFETPEAQVFSVTPVKSEPLKLEKKEPPKVSIIDLANSKMEPLEINFKKDSEVRDILNLLFAMAEVNLITDDSVSGTITLNFPKKVSFKEALNAIMLIKDLDYMEIAENTIYIAIKKR